MFVDPLGLEPREIINTTGCIAFDHVGTSGAKVTETKYEMYENGRTVKVSEATYRVDGRISPGRMARENAKAEFLEALADASGEAVLRNPAAGDCIVPAWPTDDQTVTGPYGEDRGGQPHTGVDIGC